jgi:hypothetical protein
MCGTNKHRFELSRPIGNNRDPAELRAEELAIREKFGLLQDTPLHDVTRRGSPLL